jgi:hypothetical protein
VLHTLFHGSSGVVTLVGGEAAPRRKKGGDDANLTETNLIRSKNKENSRDQFNCYK